MSTPKQTDMYSGENTAKGFFGGEWKKIGFGDNDISFRKKSQRRNVRK